MGGSVGPRFHHLLHGPKCDGISRDVAAENPAPIMPNDEKAVKDAKRQRQYGEEVHGRHGTAVIPRELQPALARVGTFTNSLKPVQYGRFRDAES